MGRFQHRSDLHAQGVQKVKPESLSLLDCVCTFSFHHSGLSFQPPACLLAPLLPLTAQEICAEYSLSKVNSRTSAVKAIFKRHSSTCFVISWPLASEWSCFPTASIHTLKHILMRFLGLLPGTGHASLWHHTVPPQQIMMRLDKVVLLQGSTMYLEVALCFVCPFFGSCALRRHLL